MLRQVARLEKLQTYRNFITDWGKREQYNLLRQLQRQQDEVDKPLVGLLLRHRQESQVRWRRHLRPLRPVPILALWQPPGIKQRGWRLL